MSVKVETKWNGDDFKLQGKKVISESIFKIGLVVEGQAKLLAPKNWGYLAASITTQSRTKGSKPDSPSKYAEKRVGKPPQEKVLIINKPANPNEVYVGTSVSYAPYMEFGTFSTNAQAFLRPALRLSRGEVLDIVKIEGKTYWKDYIKPEGLTHSEIVAGATQ